MDPARRIVVLLIGIAVFVTGSRRSSTTVENVGDQLPDSRQVQTFTCGHELTGERLRTANADGLDVDRRKSERTVTPIDVED